MPTYQTAPLLPNVFADQASKLNPYGVLPLKGNVLKHLPLEPSPHPSWKQEADLRALAKVANTKMSEMAMLQGPQPFKAQTPYTTYRGPKGDAYSHTFTGGRVWTREAEGMVSHLLKDRIGQLDALTQSTFEQVAPERLQVNIPETDTFILDKLFSDLYSSMTEGIVGKFLVSLLGSIVSYLATKGDKIPDEKYAVYEGLLGKIRQELDTLYANLNVERLATLNDATLTAAEKRKSNQKLTESTNILRKLDSDSLIASRFIKQMMKYASEPTKVKAAKLSALRNRLLQEFGQYTAYPGEYTVEPEDNTVGSIPTRYMEAAQHPERFPLDGSEAESAYSFASGNTGLPYFEEVRGRRGVPTLSPGSVNSGYGRPLRRR